MLSPYKECPVPIDQQPRNEYNALKESSLFVLPTLSLQSYLIRLFYLLFFSLTFSMPLASTSINWWKNPITFISLSIGISSLLVILVLLRTYLGWSYISKRLLSATIVYEESGWYDGEIWIKTPLELVQDRLVAQYTIKPILQRIQYSTQILIVIFIGSISYIV